MEIKEKNVNQTISTVAIISPGDMGHTVGRVLRDNGLTVITCLQERSQRTRELAQQAGIIDVDSYQELVRQADLILSILVPAQAKESAGRVAQAIATSRAKPLYADCNAIAPQTTREIGRLITNAGGRFVDAGIIGPPPSKPGATRFYASGPHASELAQLNQFGLHVIPMGDQIGQASALKMCYAASTKGFIALCTELLTAAEVLGISAPLAEEFQLSQAEVYQKMRRLPAMPEKSRRWIGEMEEIAATFEHVGLTPKILTGAADMYRFVGATSLAERTPEDTTPLPSLEEMIAKLAAQLIDQSDK